MAEEPLLVVSDAIFASTDDTEEYIYTTLNKLGAEKTQQVGFQFTPIPPLTSTENVNLSIITLTLTCIKASTPHTPSSVFFTLTLNSVQHDPKVSSLPLHDKCFSKKQSTFTAWEL